MAGYLLGLADASAVPVALVAGSIQATTGEFLSARSLADLAGSGAMAIADPLPWLERAGHELARAFPDH